MIEVWKPLNKLDVDYTGLYEISNLGRLKSLPKKRGRRPMPEYIMTTTKDKSGYLTYKICHKRKAKRVTAHRLVAIHFLDKPEGIYEVNHKDGNKANNRLENLEWVTKSRNVRHSFETRLRSDFGEGSSFSKLKEAQVIEIRRLEGSVTGSELARRFGVCHSTIRNIQIGKKWKHLASP